MPKKVNWRGIAVGGVMALTAVATITETVKAVEAVPVLLCPFGCGPTEGDTILMNQMLTRGSKVALLPQESPGYMYNIREMANPAKQKKFIFSTEDIIIQLAFQGGSSELKEFLPDPVKIRFKLLYGESWWAMGKQFVTFNCNLKSVSDLKGKRIAVGLRSQSDWGVFPLLFLKEAYGITAQNTDIRQITPAQITQQLIDGTTDAGLIPLVAEPTGKEYQMLALGKQLEATGRKMCYIGVTKEDVEKVNKKYETTFLHAEVPGGQLPHQDKPFGTGINRGYKAAHPDFPEDLAYEIVKSVATLGPKMKDLHFVWRYWSPELMLHGLSEENVHPGAKRAYVELGWWDRVKEFPAVTYPKE